MQYRTIIRILGLLLMIFSLSMLPPAFIAMDYKEIGAPAFIAAFVMTLFIGSLLWLFNRQYSADLKTRDGFLIVVLFWFVLSLFGALPLMLAYHPHLTFTDAAFEAVSGLTTTGTTVLTGIDFLPHAIRFYRQELQFLGGMGIIVLAIAILPMLGIGGMALYRAEIPGPIKDTKLTPRITETAKSLWYIYLGLTVACAVAYWFSGMSLFDAVGESFSTVATGGFSTHDTSFAYYHSTTIDMIAVVFMLLSATNFSLHFYALQKRTVKYYWKDVEFRTYIYIVLAASALVVTSLLLHHTYFDSKTSIVDGIFNTVSMITTTGLTTGNFDHWPTFLPILIMCLALIGACAASTCGGIKIIRIILLYKQGAREMNRLIHPNAILSIKFGDHTLPEPVIQAMWGFIGIYLALFVVVILVLSATGMDLRTAFSAAAASISNAGAALGAVSNNFEHISPIAKWTMVFTMIAGRLEIFSLLVLFTRTFWRG